MNNQQKPKTKKFYSVELVVFNENNTIKRMCKSYFSTKKRADSHAETLNTVVDENEKYYVSEEFMFINWCYGITFLTMEMKKMTYKNPNPIANITMGDTGEATTNLLVVATLTMLQELKHRKDITKNDIQRINKVSKEVLQV